MIFWSQATGGFHHSAVDGARLPDDAVEIGRHRHRELIDALAQGRTIVAGANGRPVLAPVEHPTVAARRAAAIAAVKSEARRRILAIAGFERQSNDNAALALGEDAAAIAAARGRRAAIDAIRAASNAIEAAIAEMNAPALDEFDPNAADWPEERA